VKVDVCFSHLRASNRCRLKGVELPRSGIILSFLLRECSHSPIISFVTVSNSEHMLQETHTIY